MPAALQLPRSLPWRQPSTSRRQVEGVRPIFWSNRPKSYLSRTADWDKFPQGRSVLLRVLLCLWGPGAMVLLGAGCCCAAVVCGNEL